MVLFRINEMRLGVCRPLTLLATACLLLIIIINSGFKSLSGTEQSSWEMPFHQELCPLVSPHLVGRTNISKEAVDLARVADEEPLVMVGGSSAPEDCASRHHVAIIIPFRNREAQLAVFLHNIHPFLRRQQIHYRIYVINQRDNKTFNRAMLMNVGFVESMKDFDWTCAIYHDVDLLPEDDRNVYSCPDQPRHMSVLVDVLAYHLRYKDLFGGVTAVRTEHFRKVNGYANSFWGWGGEDDDMSNRLKHHGLNITRYDHDLARYNMIVHKQEKENEGRWDLIQQGYGRFDDDGLSTLSYERLSKELFQLFTLVNVTLNHVIE